MIFTRNASHTSNFKFYQIENRLQKCWNPSQYLCHISLKIVFLLSYYTSTFFQNTMISIFAWLVPLTRKLISLLCIFRTEGSTTEDKEGKCLERNLLSRPSETFSISWHEWSKRHVLTSSSKDLRFEKNLASLLQGWQQTARNERTRSTCVGHADRAAIFVLLNKNYIKIWRRPLPSRFLLLPHFFLDGNSSLLPFTSQTLGKHAICSALSVNT